MIRITLAFYWVYLLDKTLDSFRKSVFVYNLLASTMKSEHVSKIISALNSDLGNENPSLKENL